MILYHEESALKWHLSNYDTVFTVYGIEICAAKIEQHRKLNHTVKFYHLNEEYIFTFNERDLKRFNNYEDFTRVTMFLLTRHSLAPGKPFNKVTSKRDVLITGGIYTMFAVRLNSVVISLIKAMPKHFRIPL